MLAPSFPPLPGTPSKRPNAGRDRLKVPSTINSGSRSATPSPTLSTQDSRNSAGVSTSISDPDDYADNLASKNVTSAGMRSKSVGRRSTLTPEAANRRASGRVRKPTAKAQALTEDKSSPSQLLDTIVIGGSPPRPPHEDGDDQPRTPNSSNLVQAQELGELEIPETPAVDGNTGPITTPPDTENAVDAGTTSLAAQDKDAAARRLSRRERKPTAKILEVSPVSLKRSAPDAQDDAPRKSVRASYHGPRVPSKLRYSASPDTTQSGSPESTKATETLSTEKSKVIVLKVPRLFEFINGKKAEAAPNATVQRRSGRRTRKSATVAPSSAGPSKRATRKAGPTAPYPSCKLACLSESSRLLAMAQIAFMMPDSDSAKDKVVPGSAQDWRVYIAQMCQCNNEEAVKSRTNSVDLQRALEPNMLSQAAQIAPIEISASPTPESEILLAPVNTILKAGEAKRVKALFNNAIDYNQMQASSPGLDMNKPARSGTRKRASMPQERSKARATLNGTPSELASQPQGSLSVPAANRYEDRLRRDQMALSDIRKRAASWGIRWTFNMSFDEIHEMVIDRETRYDQDRPRNPSRTPGHTQATPGYDNGEVAQSPSGFGLLTFTRPPPPPPATNGYENGESSRQRRASSNGKGSRFRVDPRGLQGESPGPGTIINMHDKKGARGRPSKRARAH